MRNGFTLLEVLIALVLFSFLLIMLYSSLYGAGRNWRVSEMRARENDDKRFVLSFIRKRIEQLAPVIQADTHGNHRVIFLGDDSSLQFVSSLPAQGAAAGIFFMKLQLRQDELMLSHLPLARDKTMFGGDIFTGAEEISLARNIGAIGLDYFGQGGADSAPAWRDDWHIRERLPELVRVRIVSDSHSPWPELLIAVRSRADPGQPQLALYPEENGDSG
ncbi:MAG: prepilin-type N-terminal cleavage/methylation domain-containing protein [Gammaproteobacteria bacterium]|nr:prepilin-type N-terminal cleavage/methylation domain-containing protein [Gammaproteobacteria bacterium]